MVGAQNQSRAAERHPAGDPLVAAAVPPEVLSAIVEAGAAAPSGDNCQPWRFRWDGQALDILFLPERAESFYDVGHAASWISLGAVLTNMELAARSRGLEPRVELWPEGEPAAVAARLRFIPCEPARDPLAAAIAARCVNRGPYRRALLPPAVRTEILAAGAAIPGVKVRLVEEPGPREKLAALAALNDRLLFEHRALHQGLYRWLRWSREETERTRDGMPVESLDLARMERPGFRLLSRWPCARLLAALGATRALPARARRAYARSAAIGLVSVRGRSPADFVEGGRAVERLWLTAALRNVAFQPITGITFLLLRLWLHGGEGLSAAHRRLLGSAGRRLRDVLALGPDEVPVMLFRVGLAAPPRARALRLRVQDLLAVVGH